MTFYRHFPSKDDLIAGYLAGRADRDHLQVDGIIASHPDDPRRALTELATALTSDDFAAVGRGCPFINACAEFDSSHPTREYALEIRRWVTDRLEELLTRVGHRTPRAAAEQLMMVRTGAVVSGALDRNQHLNQDFLSCWEAVIDAGTST